MKKEKTVSTSSQKAMNTFIDFSTLDERLKESNTITEEFLNPVFAYQIRA